MTRISLLLLGAVMLASCNNGSPMNPTIADLKVSGGAAVVAGSEEGLLRLTVTVQNVSNRDVEYVAPLHCPLLLILDTPDTGSGDPVVDETSSGCTRAGQIIRLSPGEKHTWTRHITAAQLEQYGVRHGQFVVQAIVSAPTPVSVPLGQVEL